MEHSDGRDRILRPASNLGPRFTSWARPRKQRSAFIGPFVPEVGTPLESFKFM